MASILPGYEYDIFISYRQKDNKYDGWVTEFVSNLRMELDTTFKEDVSIYFDINPSDALLESYEVNASLREKLKCLIFIPIISQTYCDAKSFAWQNEFCAFNKQAKDDPLGRDIKLNNGNTASRILPVRIHEVDPSDKILIENELGGSLRGIEFIYRSIGVNRPLRSNEDHPLENLNKTYYRDQINKTANAVKEMLNALKNPQHNKVENSGKEFKARERITLNRKTKIISIISVFIALIIIGYIFVPKGVASEDHLEKSIAVLPFVNDSPDEENTYFINSVMYEILSNLQKIKEFRVLPRTSTEQYKGSNKPAIPEIAKNLNVNYIVEGSGQKYGNTFRLNIKLIDAKKEKYLWVNSYEQEITEAKDILNLQSQVAQSIASNLHGVITPEEKRRIEKSSTLNLTALDFYQKGQAELDKYPWPEFSHAALKRAEFLFHKALENDSSFAKAYIGLASIYQTKADGSRKNNVVGESDFNRYLDSMRIFANKALACDIQLEDAYIMRGVYYHRHGETKMALEEYDKVITLNPNSFLAYVYIGEVYNEYDILKALQNYHKAVSLDPGSSLYDLLKSIAHEYFRAGFPEIGSDYLLKAYNLDGDSIGYYNELMEYTDGSKVNKIEYYEKKYLADTTDLVSLLNLGRNYICSGDYKKSLKYYKLFLSKINKPVDIKNPKISLFIGFSYLVNGYKQEADYFLNKQIEKYNEIDKLSYWNNYVLAGIYVCKGDKIKAYKHLKLSTQTSYSDCYFLDGLKTDPWLNSIRNEPEFQKILREAEAKYESLHESVKKWMEEQGEL